MTIIAFPLRFLMNTRTSHNGIGRCRSNTLQAISTFYFFAIMHCMFTQCLRDMTPTLFLFKSKSALISQRSNGWSRLEFVPIQNQPTIWLRFELKTLNRLTPMLLVSLLRSSTKAPATHFDFPLSKLHFHLLLENKYYRPKFVINARQNILPYCKVSSIQQLHHRL